MSEEFRDLIVDQLVALTSFDFDTAELCVAEFFDRFMVLKKTCKDYDGKKVCPSKKIDLVWQHTILNTKLYAEFCNDFAEKLFHYNPQPMIDEFQMRLLTTKYHDTLMAYNLMFGKPNEKIWPLLSKDQTTLIFNHSAWVRRIPGYGVMKEDSGNDDDDDDEVTIEEVIEEQSVKKKRSGMCLFVNFFGHRCRQLVAESDDKIVVLAEQLFESEKIEIEKQQFVYNGKILDSERTFCDYNIQKNSTLEMRLRLRGC